MGSSLPSEIFQTVASVPAAALRPDRAQASTPLEVARLHLLIHQVKCVKGTCEVRTDELTLGGVLTSLVSRTTVIVPALELGEFSTGCVKMFSKPLNLQTLCLRKGGSEFPQSYLAVLRAGTAGAVFSRRTLKPVLIESLQARFEGGSLDSPKETLVFLGATGRYEVTVSWRLAA